MNKGIILPKMAFTGIRKNGIVYFPYILTSAFSVCIFFIFNCIINNEFLKNVPHAEYVWLLLQIGNVLLGFILIPFLFYTNSFLIKRRKKEIGLYSILGLEKKHIAIMMFLETFFIYMISMIIGLITAVVFAKLSFLILLNASGLPIDITFTMPVESFLLTFAFFGVVSFLNLGTNLFQVTRANPSDLLRDPQKGEKEPKHIWILALLGIVFLGSGYYIAVVSEINSMIFVNFFLAVLLVVIGTYFLFTSGSIVLLRTLRKNKKFYYKKSNYITVSGMIYRMKKSAASLVNICIFSTMVIITLLCTVSLTLGEKSAIRFNYPLDANYIFEYDKMADENHFNSELSRLAEENQVKIADKIEFPYFVVTLDERENIFSILREDTGDNESSIRLLSLSDFNSIESQNMTLEDNEILVYSNTDDFKYDSAIVNGKEYRVKKELNSLRFDTKERNNYSSGKVYFVLKDYKSMEEMAKTFHGDTANPYYSVWFNMDGEISNKEALLDDLDKACAQMPGFYTSKNIIDWGYDVKSMDGGLLFIGVFFGLIFTICLLLIMYYKQISEGIEDKQNFIIMQQVGLSDDDVKSTIHRQIMLVFGLPLVVAILHTMMGLKITIRLLYALNLYNTNLILLCALGIIAVFTVFYILSYFVTASTYYKIVKGKS
ncbi:ABC transporter permease [Anaerotignum propionicum]|uniref:ABC transporter permease n=1 Tax=Anaerotignum propionicum TaxID=28446 RepID=UPI00210E7E14|nr:ABC transporter permease [Anaerotignum propionicum]MCQ4935258.1 ABC transporter permease [Anaerotignum propionicum]